jgi:glutamate-ammonia-ligase adenylyltransferase
MRKAIAAEKGDSDRWDLKYVAGGLTDIEFIAQYLQLVHACEMPDLLDPSTAGALDKAWRSGVLATQDAEVLRSAVRLYHDLTQILRLCLPQPFDPATAAPGSSRYWRGPPTFPISRPSVHFSATQAKVRLLQAHHRVGRSPD